MFYTLRKAGDPTKPVFELSKWDENRIHPLEVYVQWVPQRGDGSYSVHSCNCPSRSNPCKHEPITQQLLSRGLNELPYIYWDADMGEVKITEDTARPEDMKGLFT